MTQAWQALTPTRIVSATLTPVAGLVQYLARGASDWVTLQDTQLFNKGDQLRTGSDGYARLNVVTGIQVDVYQTSIVEMNSLEMGPESGETLLTWLFPMRSASRLMQYSIPEMVAIDSLLAMTCRTGMRSER